ncbi:MAG: hypothetical protein J6M43_03605 [Neisseriaceae bacterium]|nr:hypothetical protein [Neisseriaceae bacterium]
MNKIKNYFPLIRFTIITIISSIISYFVLPYFHGNKNAMDMLVNIFSILVGVLIAIMTFFIGVKNYSKDIELGQLILEKELQEKRYKKYVALFYCYLSSLIVIFVLSLFSSENSFLVRYLEFFCLSSTGISFIYSFILPNNLWKIHEDEFEKLKNKKPPTPFTG